MSDAASEQTDPASVGTDAVSDGEEGEAEGIAVVPCALHSINPRHPNLQLELRAGERFRFGRNPNCEQTFPSDNRISGVHAMLTVVTTPAGPRLSLLDTSVNGTFVNGQRVQRNAQRILESGDEVFLVIPNHQVLSRAGCARPLPRSLVHRPIAARTA